MSYINIDRPLHGIGIKWMDVLYEKISCINWKKRDFFGLESCFFTMLLLHVCSGELDSFHGGNKKRIVTIVKCIYGSGFTACIYSLPDYIYTSYI